METRLASRLRERDGVLDDLLMDARRDSAEFPVTLANHGPMVLAILDRLGASDERLHQALARYREANALVPVPLPVGAIDLPTWTRPLGDRSREGDYRAFFAHEVAAFGIDETLRRFLPTLIPGVAGSALHPLMRLAYGLLREDPAEVAVALAYWAACFMALPPCCESRDRSPTHPGTVQLRRQGADPVVPAVAFEADDPATVLARVATLPSLRALPAQSLLWHDIRATAAEPEFAPVVDWLRIGPDTLPRMAATSLALFAGTMHFAALHALTGTHWVRMVLTVCPDPLLIRQFWQTIAALVPAIGFPDLPSDAQLQHWRERPCPAWPVLLAAALESDDEHDISLVFSAREEQKIYGDRLYRVVAARRLGLIA